MKKDFDERKPIIEIKRPTLKDVYGIQEVLYRTWLATYPNEEFKITADDIEDRFKNRKSKEALEKRKKQISSLPDTEVVLVAKEGNKVIGFCRASKHEDRNQLHAIYVLPEYQRRNIGKSFWYQAQKYFDRSKDTIVQVAEYNYMAIKFYMKLGFRDTGKRWKDEKYKMKSGAMIPEMEMVIKGKKARL